MILQNGNKPPRGSERPIQGGRNMRLTSLITIPGTQPAGLIRRAVRSRRQLPIRILGRNPCFGIKLACGGRSQVTTGNINNPVGHLNGGEHVALHPQQLLMLGGSLLRLAIDKHFQFVKLVNPDNAASVLPIAASLPTETRRPPRILPRPITQINDLILVISSKSHLGCTHQI